jgi:hypothetical protein
MKKENVLKYVIYPFLVIMGTALIIYLFSLWDSTLAKENDVKERYLEKQQAKKEYISTIKYVEIMGNIHSIQAQVSLLRDDVKMMIGILKFVKIKPTLSQCNSENKECKEKDCKLKLAKNDAR